jgi:hypothetical protein
VTTDAERIAALESALVDLKAKLDRWIILSGDAAAETNRWRERCSQLEDRNRKLAEAGIALPP